MPVVNYEGIVISDEQVRAFRNALQSNWEETLSKKPKEWNEELLKVTEGRKSQYKDGVRTFFYSWCGDWVSYHLYRAGSRAKCLNRVEVNGKWHAGMNLSMPRIWAGDEDTRRWVPQVIKDLVPESAEAWHPWDNDGDRCKDGYVPACGDLLICPRKNGDHIEFWVGLEDKILTVSAGAQAGGIACIRTRDLDIESLVGVIDVSKLASSEPY